MDTPRTFAEMLAQMRWALQEEIKADQKDKRRYPARSGKDLSSSGVSRYQFQCKALWEPRIDTPILIEPTDVDGTPLALKGHVEAFQQGTITIVSEEPLPPHALDQIMLSENSSELLERLDKALEGRQEGSLHLASKLFGLMEPVDGQAHVPARIGTFVPDGAQRRAIERALGSQLLYLIGPPGTGKTVTLAAIVLLALLQGKSVLVAAHTNIALDNAFVRLVDLVHSLGEHWRLEQGQIIRFGTPRLAAFAQDPYSQVTIRGRTRERVEQLEQLEQERVQRFTVMEREEKELAAKTQRWQRTQQQQQAKLEERGRQLRLLEEQEQQRLRRLDLKSQHLEQQIHSTQQAASQLQATLDRLWRASNELLKIQRQIDAHRAEVTARLQNIEDMHPVWRFLVLLSAGFHLQALRQEITDLTFRLMTNQQRLDGIAREQEAAQRTHEQLAATLEALSKQAQQAATGYTTPSAEAHQIAQLQAELSQIRARIAQENATQVQAVAQLEKQRDDYGFCCERMAQLKAEIRVLENQSLIEAQIVGATLTTLFLHPHFSGRYFDLVVIDEASMAAPAALCYAATRALESVIVIGDPLQLAPICKSTDAHARKWVGTDVYTLAGVTLDEAAQGKHHSVLLTHQARMHPDISALVNKIFYKGYLQDRVRPDEEWLRIAPYPEHALLLCDTSHAKPRTQRPETGKSRYNMYHIECVVALVQQALQTLPSASSDVPRIGIVAPYAPHVFALRRCLKEAQLNGAAQVGTVHAYQGLEFDVVIYDTVESPPLSLVPDFTAGAWGSEAMRLVNVALSRAKHKLIIVANREYLRELQRKSGSEHVLVSVVEETYQHAHFSSSELFGDAEQE